MAQRLTSEHADSLILETTTPLIRITSVHVDSLFFETAVPEVKITSIYVDTLIITVPDVVSVSVSDSLRNWNDALSYNYLAPPGPLSRAIVDKFIRNGSINGNNLSLRDGLSWVMSPTGPVNISISDLGSFLNDDVMMNQGFLFTDSMSLTDVGKVALGNFRDVTDSMSFTDLVSVFLVANLNSSSSDLLNSWLDSLVFTILSSSILGDSLSFADSLVLELISSTSFSDSLGLSDSLALILNHPLSFSDQLVFSDSFTSSEAILQDVLVSDDLNSWSDSVTSLSSTGETMYLRQYLNDVIN
jgi:hypothetical protein